MAVRALQQVLLLLTVLNLAALHIASAYDALNGVHVYLWRLRGLWIHLLSTQRVKRLLRGANVAHHVLVDLLNVP